MKNRTLPLIGCVALFSVAPACDDDAGTGSGTELDLTEPDGDTSEFDATDTDIHEPDLIEADGIERDVPIPDVTEMDGAEPDVFEPDVTDPDTTDPDVTDPDVTDPDASTEDVAPKDVAGGEPSEGDECDEPWLGHCDGSSPILYCDGAKWADPQKNGFVGCFCEGPDAEGKQYVICAVPGFVGIGRARAGRPITTTRLRRIA